MAFPINDYPYTDLHEMNMDYVLRQVKSIPELIEKAVSELDIKDVFARDRLKKLDLLYTEMAADSDNYSDGDIIITRGYQESGIGAGVYLVHDAFNALYIPFGSKYAELLFDDVIDIEALGCPHTDESATDTVNKALAIIQAKRNSIPLSSGYCNGGATIKFSHYLYTFSTQLTIPTNLSRVRFQGDSVGSTLFAFDGAGYLISPATKTDGTKNDDFIVDSITFLGSGSMINMTLFVNSIISRCRFFGNGNPIRITGNSVNNAIRDCMIIGATIYGIYVDGIVTTLTIDKCYIQSCDTGLYIDGQNQAAGIIVSDSIFELNTKAFNLVKTFDVCFNDCWFEGNPANISGSKVELNNVQTYIGQNGVDSTITNDTLNGLSRIIARNVNTDVLFSTLDPTYSAGRIEYTNGEYFDTSKRELCVINRSSITINFGQQIEGFVEGTGEYGTLYGYFKVDPGVSASFTKDGGSLAGMYAVYNTGELVLLGFGARNTVRITY